MPGSPWQGCTVGGGETGKRGVVSLIVLSHTYPSWKVLRVLVNYDNVEFGFASVAGVGMSGSVTSVIRAHR